MSRASGPEGPEWLSATIVQAVQRTDDGPRRVAVRVGVVRLPGASGTRLAVQVFEPAERDMFILPPASAARLRGALSRALRELGLDLL